MPDVDDNETAAGQRELHELVRVFGHADTWTRYTGSDPNVWAVQRGSLLADDSARTDPYQLSHRSSGVWERLHYDWSDPNRVVLTTIDSNVRAGASGYTYTFIRRPDGKTDVDVVVVREGKNVKGRALEFLVRVAGTRTLRGQLKKTIKAIEARNRGADAA